jgi:hypothetical protein
MDAQALLPVDTDTLLALLVHLRRTGSEHSLAQAAALAVRAWIAGDARADNAPGSIALADTALSDNALATKSHPADALSLKTPTLNTRVDNALADDGRTEDERPSARSQSTATGPARGYQWKELFLPDGTEVRMRCDGDVHHARVNGDSIVYQSHRVSPRQFTLVVAGDGRNAWRDLSLRLPGAKGFQPASLLRHRARAASKSAGITAPESPSATIAAAAASMSEALRTALQLVEHSNAQPLPRYERRVDSHRRAADVFTDHTTFD